MWAFAICQSISKSSKHRCAIGAGSDKNAINLVLEGQLQHNLPVIDHKSIREVMIIWFINWVGIRAISITCFCKVICIMVKREGMSRLRNDKVLYTRCVSFLDTHWYISRSAYVIFLRVLSRTEPVCRAIPVRVHFWRYPLRRFGINDAF